ncbi:DNA primase DnaG [Haloarchaeobius sp. HME9146]|uniref:DNA primase DnaG n=1 Tax=Haloarchaeobius sp. HME9146 TaxID=2978732 RepID=UPI0021C0F4BE|nr:DNA primase DnaG [Haloarchaeobius sp. HME9146]MCT9097670.1 DNA primase DnaG [Haloarchaeobius sp. HME9146]
MDDTSKYLIHANITADGVVERSDVVGAIFGQTEGLLGDELDLRDLQQSSKVGRIDVEIQSEAGRSFGEVTIATSIDKVATATLAAALETITRVGPCAARLEVTDIEDVRAAKRREVVERAKELLATSFDDSIMSSEEILREVRQHVRVEDITEYDGLPAGPRVEDSDAIVVVEGRADVLQLLKYGIKNAIAVEGTNVPEAVADLTQEKTVTAFLDGDRGGDLILKELSQVAEVDYVAFAPEGKSVEDMLHHEVFEALREKVPFEVVAEKSDPHVAIAATDGSTVPAPEQESSDTATPESPDEPASAGDGAATAEAAAAEATAVTTGGEAANEAATATTAAEAENATSAGSAETEAAQSATAESAETDAEPADDPAGVETLRGHVAAVLGDASGEVRLLDDEWDVLAADDAEEAFELVRDADEVPHAVVLDGELSQRVLDVAAQRGVDHVVAREFGEFVKRPTTVRIRTGDQLLGEQ